MTCCTPCCPRDPQESSQPHNSKTSILQCSVFFIVQLSHSNMTTRKTCQVSDSVPPYELQPARLLSPCDSPSKNAGVDCNFLLQGLFPTQVSNPYLLHQLALAGGFFVMRNTWETWDKNIALTIWIIVTKVMSLLFNMLSRFVIAFLPRSKRLLISWLQSPSAVIFEPKKIKSACFHCFPICLP